MKILLIEKEPWTTKSRKDPSQTISGVSYIGILPNGQIIKFTSKMDHDHALEKGTLIFDEAKALDLDIRPKIFNNRMSYYEAQAE